LSRRPPSPSAGSTTSIRSRRSTTAAATLEDLFAALATPADGQHQRAAVDDWLRALWPD
jgi:hypothetical protein